MKTKRLEILEASLAKKEAQFDARLAEHFDTVKQANGQPLNDKRNGRTTLAKWDRQNDALRNLQDSIQKTKDAIEYEKGQISGVENMKEVLPDAILELIESGAIVQWRKHPRIFFVVGVDKARIQWDLNKRVVAHSYYNVITDPEQRKRFREVYNGLANILNK